MTKKFITLQWSRKRILHIARHNVTQDEVEEAIFDDKYSFLKKNKQSYNNPGQYIYLAYGSTLEGRLLTIILLSVNKNVFIPITARDMDSAERKNYLKRRQY